MTSNCHEGESEWSGRMETWGDRVKVKGKHRAVMSGQSVTLRSSFVGVWGSPARRLSAVRRPPIRGTRRSADARLPLLYGWAESLLRSVQDCWCLTTKSSKPKTSYWDRSVLKRRVRESDQSWKLHTVRDTHGAKTGSYASCANTARQRLSGREH